VAGINAANYIEGAPYLILDRASSYIGVLIDDIVTKGTKEPYRIMTSRVEYRLLLRQDNADMRLMPLGYKYGLISEERYQKFLKKKAAVENEYERLKNTKICIGGIINDILKENETSEITSATSLYELMKRPQITYAMLAPADTARQPLPPDVVEQVEIMIKYEDYIKKQAAQVEKFKKTESKIIPADFDYARVKNLRIEARQKLTAQRPGSVGQASRISGVSPADITALLIELMKH
jgi:tRNA uridine 5-carboxymethylaminomethyl modification enzyme